MYAIDALKIAAKNAHVPITHIGQQLTGDNAYVSKIANRKSNPQTNTMAKMLDVIGYKLVIVPSDNIPSDAIIID